MNLRVIIASSLLATALGTAGAQAGTLNTTTAVGSNYVTLSDVIPCAPGSPAPFCSVTPTGFVTLSQFASQSDLNITTTAFNNSLAHLKKEAWHGTALAASLTTLLPTGDNKNELNFATADAHDTPGFSLNYAHVEGHWNFVAAAATTDNYSIGKVGVGFSW